MCAGASVWEFPAEAGEGEDGQRNAGGCVGRAGSPLKGLSQEIHGVSSKQYRTGELPVGITYISAGINTSWPAFS